MTTRRGRALRAVRVRLAFGLSLVFAVSSASVAAGEDATRIQTTLHGDSSGCLTQRALDARIAHYLSSTAQVTAGLRVHVRAPDAGPTEFEVEHAGTPVAVRGFETLPDGCSDRLNAIAIAVAIAVEQAAHSQAVGADAPARVEPAAAAPVEAEARGAGVAQPHAVSRMTNGPSQRPAGDARPKRAATAEPESREDGRAPAANPHPPSVPAAPVVASHEAEPETDATDQEPIVLEVNLHAGASVVFRVLPGVAIGGIVGGELSFGDIGLRLSALVTAETRTPFQGGHALMRLLGGRFLFCHRVPLAWTTLHPCSGVIGGGFFTRGEGYADSRPDRVLWLAALARVGLRLLDRAPLALELAAEVYGNLVRPRLGVEGSIDSLTTPYVGASGGVEITLALF